jgi:hypothetical protein
MFSEGSGQHRFSAKLESRKWSVLMNWIAKISLVVAIFLTVLGFGAPQPAAAQDKKPNILVITGDDVGWFNLGAYHQVIMSGKTPNLDKLAAGGMRFIDYYAEASCTAGRGEIPLRTGVTIVGQAGAHVGIPDQAATLASALKEQGYETFQIPSNALRRSAARLSIILVVAT